MKTSATQTVDISDVREDIGEIVQISQLMTGKVCCLFEGIADVNALKVSFRASQDITIKSWEFILLI